MIQIRYIEGNWEVIEDGDTGYFSGRYAIENIHSCYRNVDRLMDEAKAHPVAFDCKELAPHFRKFIRFRNGSWERLNGKGRNGDGTWTPKSSLSAIRGCLVYHRRLLRPSHLKAMLDYLKTHQEAG